MKTVGKNIEWEQIIRQVFRVLNFDKNGTIIGENGQAVAKSIFKPYGYLLVESPILNESVKIPITHQDDFILASSVYDNPRFSEDIKNNDLLVTYIPKNNLPGGIADVTHALHYVITDKNTLAEYYSKHSHTPKPELVFPNISWEGYISVGINMNPEL